MFLNADDFGCKPDGRFLERSSIAAGSAVLTDPDGILRVTDAGKNIAIPGAVDLVARVASLLERREVRNVVMNAGSSQLTGTLFDPTKPPAQDEEPFKQSVHVGRRITVAGAGPNGETLVSDIVQVTGDTTIVLASQASTSVSGIEVILNRADRVALDDYARRTVENLTIDLGDRSISDGEMTVGGRGLTSQTARFSSLDLGKEVTVREAGLLVTTIQSFDSSTQITLLDPAQRAVFEGQVDIWKTDSRPGLEALLAALEGLDVASAEIRFGPGVYDFMRVPPSGSPMNGVIGLQDLKNVTIRGTGPGATILRLMPQQDLGRPDTHVLETRNCKRLAIRDLSIHGAYLTMDKTNEQMHGVFLNEGSEEIIIERVRIFQTAGDGLRFLGRAEDPDTGRVENKVRKVWVEGCEFVQNKRTGIAFQREVEHVWVHNCYIEMTPPSTDSCVDFEPTGNRAPGRIFVSPTDIIIDSNVMKHGTLATAVSISGVAGPDPTRRVKFSNNIITGGDIFCTDVEQLTLQNNTILVPILENRNRIPIQIQRGGDAVIITGNLLVNDNPATQAVISLSEVNRRQVTRALVADNLCFTRSATGIECLSSDDVDIHGNMIVATNASSNGIFVRAQSSAMDQISVRDNDITVRGAGRWKFGIRIAAGPQPISHISITGNSIRGADKGIAFDGSAYRQTPVCAFNRIADDVPDPFTGIKNLPFHTIITGGAASRGGSGANFGAGRLLAGLGNPENRILGNVGDIFQSLDGTPGMTLFVKESGNGTSDGWTAK